MSFPDPLTIEWEFGAVPPVEAVPYDCRILLWSGCFVGLISPWGDRLNYLRWHDAPCARPRGYWCWIIRGSERRPAHVKTYDEWRFQVFEHSEHIRVVTREDMCDRSLADHIAQRHPGRDCLELMLSKKKT